MVQNTSSTPATAGGDSITGSTGSDQISGGGGDDTLNGGNGNDRLTGDAPQVGQWQYSVYDHNFGNTPNQTQFITDGTLIGQGYVDDFSVLALRNRLGGTASNLNRDDFGIVYRSSLNITTGGSYTFSTRSDDGSRIIIRDSNGNIVFNLDNDFNQSATTRSGSVVLAAGQSYTIEVLYWEDTGQSTLSATVTSPGATNAAQLATSPLIGTPPLAPGHVAGNDLLYGGAGSDTLYGDGGSDTLYGGTEQDRIYGGVGNDLLYGEAGNDALYGGEENDTLDGGTGNDTLQGGSGSGLFWGGDGNDRILYGAGNDTVYGGAGNDIIDDQVGATLPGANLIYGGDGNDQIWSGEDADTIFGGAGNDTLTGEAGNDIIYGGTGADSMSGGDGRDTFYFFDGDFATGDVVDGGEGGDDFDRLDLSGYGWSRFTIQYTAADREDGIIRFFSATGVLLGSMVFRNIEQIIPCFAAGTLIDTPDGPCAVETLRAGDLVDTLDSGPQPLRWVASRSLSLAELVADPTLVAVRIAPGALGDNLPTDALTVSPQHRILFSGARCELHFGEDEVLVPAIHLSDRPGITRPLQPVTYVHLMFDAHQILHAAGVWSESYQPGAATLSGLPDPQRDELFRLFPALAEGSTFPAARSTLRAYESRLLFAA